MIWKSHQSKKAQIMKTLLSRILLMAVGCLALMSCTKETQVTDVDRMIDISLSLSISGTAYTKDVDNRNQTLDYTTNLQNRVNDLYILLVDVNGKIQYVVDELIVQNTDNTLYEGSIERPDAGSVLVLMANLNQQNLSSSTDTRTWLDGFIGQDIENLYNAAVFFNASGIWELEDRSIPMWGEVEIGTPVDGKVYISCNLYKALAKINIWVNEKQGIDGFAINKVVVRNSLDRGYCVSQSDLNPDINIQYQLPYVPANAANRSTDAEYTNLNITDAYSDAIYVVEQSNGTVGTNAIELDVHYTIDGEPGVGTIAFKDDNGNAFDVVRNHSYIFNITNVSGTQTSASLIYDVMDYYDIHKIDIGFN